MIGPTNPTLEELPEESFDLRCEHKLHGRVLQDGRVEVKCSSSFCGAEPGVVVLHRFDLHTRDVETLKVKDPGRKGVS